MLLKERDGFELQFDFSENPFFSNRTLTKVCITKLDEEDGEDMLTKLIGTDIAWNDGKNLTVELKKKKQRFFNFFSPPEVPDDDDEDDNDEKKKKKKGGAKEECKQQ
eukprot:gene16714-50451_t